MNRAFSLVELSIVLVVLGLLTGGVLAGKSLIRAGELRSVTSEYQRYVTATHSFRDKYFMLPGDISNATSFWGIAAGGTGNDSTCRSQASTDSRTCNGNGDGLAGPYIVMIGNNNWYFEMYRFWQHLANAGLIEGQYTGVSGIGSSYDASIRTNIPGSKLTSAGWSVTNFGNYTGGGGWFSANYGHFFMFGIDNGNYYTNAAALKPEEAWNIDSKLDDGMPGQGRVIAILYDGCTLAASQTDNNAGYELTSNDVSCALAFTRAF